MNEESPDRDQPDDVDDYYRRASELDTSRPSDAVRRAVLDHATRLAAERAAANAPARLRRTGVHRPLIFGTLAAAALAGLLVLPRLLAPSAPPVTEAPAIPSSEGAKEVESRNSADVDLTPPPPALAPPRALQPAPLPAIPPPETPPPREPQPQEAPPPQAPSPQAAPPPTALEAAPPPVQERKAAPAEDRRASAAATMRSEAARMAAPSARRESLADQTEAPTAALRQAAEAGDLSRLQALLDAQIDVDSPDDMGRTALMLAVLQAHGDAVEVLLQHGADPNAADSNGATPLQAAMARDEPAIAEALRRKGAR